MWSSVPIITTYWVILKLRSNKSMSKLIYWTQNKAKTDQARLYIVTYTVKPLFHFHLPGTVTAK